MINKCLIICVLLIIMTSCSNQSNQDENNLDAESQSLVDAYASLQRELYKEIIEIDEQIDLEEEEQAKVELIDQKRKLMDIVEYVNSKMEDVRVSQSR